jgi:hypothetical protein
VDDMNKWQDEAEPMNSSVEQAVGVSMGSDNMQTRDDDGQLAGWIPALVLLALILLSPFIYDAVSVLTRIP